MLFNGHVPWLFSPSILFPDKSRCNEEIVQVTSSIIMELVIDSKFLGFMLNQVFRKPPIMYKENDLSQLFFHHLFCEGMIQ